MRLVAPLAAALLAVAALPLPSPFGAPGDDARPDPDAALAAPAPAPSRIDLDLEALSRFRPSYPFWAHVFTIPDGRVAFGSATDGRLLAVFPARGDWTSEGLWEDPTLQPLLGAEPLPRGLDDRRVRVASLLEAAATPAVHNPTRGDFFLPNARRYGGFLGEWSAIYERFGVPADLGLAQALVESGFAGKVKSGAGAIGFCQWLPRNWTRLNRLTSWVIEAENQTTQAAFCAAYLTVLATKYGSFIPALSEHHAGGANVGRTVINGGRLGAADIRERYFVGAELARDLRALSFRRYRDVVGTYGPRSFLYAEMVFGNRDNVSATRSRVAQSPIVAMRAPRAISIEEVVRRSGLSTEEVKRYNPALVRRVPQGATLYLPEHVRDFGPDVSFWRREAPPGFAALLEEFTALDEPVERWEDPGFEAVLQDFRRRFRATDSEEGRIMDAVIAYVIQELPLSRRVLGEYRSDPRVDQLIAEGLRERDSAQAAAR